MRKLRPGGDSEKTQTCTQREAEASTAVDRRRPQVSPTAHPLLTHGTGAMEKNIDLMIGRRFKL
jgi:hypothetical protein